MSKVISTQTSNSIISEHIDKTFDMKQTAVILKVKVTEFGVWSVEVFIRQSLTDLTVSLAKKQNKQKLQSFEIFTRARQSHGSTSKTDQ